MAKYGLKQRIISRRFLAVMLTVGVVLVIGLGGLAWYVRGAYTRNLAPVSDSIKQSQFTVVQGSTVREIATGLEKARLIRSATAFEWYVRNQEVRDKLQAGTYVLMPSLTTQQIVQKMVDGEVAKNLLTILPGKRLDQVKEAFVKAGYSPQAVEAALDPSQYRDHPALASLPANATLEGYLYPDSYERLTNTPASTIIRASLNEMAGYLTPDLQAAFARHGLSVFQAITLASIVDQEVSKVDDKPVVAQVFLRRLRENMPLGADPTSRYASVMAGLDETDYSIDSPYNTRVKKGLPPGPIGNVTRLGLEAVANPASTNFLYFVAGDDGITRFSHTREEHETLTEKYCIRLCAQ